MTEGRDVAERHRLQQPRGRARRVGVLSTPKHTARGRGSSSDDDRLYFWHRAMFAAAVDTIRHNPDVAELVTEHLVVITRWVDQGAPRDDCRARYSLSLLYRHMVEAGVEPPRTHALRVIQDSQADPDEPQSG